MSRLSLFVCLFLFLFLFLFFNIISAKNVLNPRNVFFFFFHWRIELLQDTNCCQFQQGTHNSQNYNATCSSNQKRLSRLSGVLVDFLKILYQCYWHAKKVCPSARHEALFILHHRPCKTVRNTLSTCNQWSTEGRR